MSAASLNKAQLIGNLGQDPEVRSTSSGTRVATLSVATNRSWTDRNGTEQTDTNWHRVVLWERLAEVAEEYLAKGDRVFVEGRISYRQWEGDDGETRYATEIVGRRLIMLGSSKGRSGGRRRDPPPPEEEPSEDDFSEEALMGGEDDLPF